MPSSPLSDAVRAANARYWRRNVTLTLVLLVGWFLIGLGCGVLFVEPLNEITFGGFKLGFWFAQQGAIVGFVVLILIYAIGMGRLDRSYREELRRLGGYAEGRHAEGGHEEGRHAEGRHEEGRHEEGAGQ